MSYIVNYSTSTKTPITINTATIDNSTSISLIGKNSSGFGEVLAENFLHILENFASSVEPNNSIEGQLWYDISDVNKKVLKVKSGVGSDWRPVSNIYFQTQEPSSAISGEIWIKYEDNNINFYTFVAGTGWINLAQSYVFVSTTQPTIAEQGRVWFNPANKKLFIYTSTWTSIQSPAVYGTSVPSDQLVTGQIWYNTNNNTSFIYNGTNWIQLVATLTSNDITFIQTGAGAVSRSLQSKNREFITPQDYGATANGITNDTVAFIAANSAAGGKSVFVPDGSYVISGAITGNFVALGNPTFIGGTITIKKTNDLSSIVTGALNLNSYVTGTLAVINGGTGISSPGTINNVLRSDGAGNWTSTAISTLVPDATTTIKGIVELAETSEVQTGTDQTKAITPSTLRTGNLVHTTVQSPTSGTSINFAIPSWAKRITVMFYELSMTTASASLQLRLGGGGVIETTNYFGVVGYTNGGGGAGANIWSNSMIVGSGDNASGIVFNGSAILTRLSATSTVWTLQSTVTDRVGELLVWNAGGSTSLAGAIDTVQVLISGTSQFSSGSINVMYE